MLNLLTKTFFSIYAIYSSIHIKYPNIIKWKFMKVFLLKNNVSANIVLYLKVLLLEINFLHCHTTTTYNQIIQIINS